MELISKILNTAFETYHIFSFFITYKHKKSTSLAKIFDLGILALCKGGETNTASHIQNSQLLKFIPEILNKMFAFDICLKTAFTTLDINRYINSGRISE